MQKKASIAELGAHCWFDIEGTVDNLFSRFIKFLFFWTLIYPEGVFHVLLEHVSAHDLWLSRLARLQLSDDLDFGSELNLDRDDPTV